MCRALAALPFASLRSGDGPMGPSLHEQLTEFLLFRNVPESGIPPDLLLRQTGHVTFTLPLHGARVEGHMGIVRRFDRRRESRCPADLQVLVWGVDGQGERFLQEAHARDISLNGALLSGLDADLQSGDVVGVLYGKNKARYRVVWIRYDGAGDKMLVAVHRMESDACPWLELLVERETHAEPVQPPEQTSGE